MENSCVAHMKRYNKGGNAALCCFEDCNGIVRDYLFPQAKEFYFTINDLAVENDDYLEYRCFRQFKQYGTFALQLICGIILLISIINLFKVFL